MTEQRDPDERMLSLAERTLVDQTKPPAVDALDKDALLALGRLLRALRDRALRIGHRQRREMRGKSGPRGRTVARDNAGTERKAQVLIAALERIEAALHKLNPPTGPEILRKAMAMKRAAPQPWHPGAAATAAKGMRVKASKQPTVRADPREIGRVSQAIKVAQAKRDR